MKKRKQRAKQGEPQTITKAITHIRLEATNAGKLTALDAVASVYLELTQQYVTLFCTTETPNGFRVPCFLTPLSERWHRNAIQQAAGIAKSWRSNRANAYQDYLDALAEYQEQKADGTLEEGAKEPEWREWNVPTLRQPCIQANSNVIRLEDATDSAFDYWLKLSTLDKGNPLLMPVKLADYHKEQLTDPETGQRRKINGSVTLNKRDEAWWLTLSKETDPISKRFAVEFAATQRMQTPTPRRISPPGLEIWKCVPVRTGRKSKPCCSGDTSNGSRMLGWS